MNKQIVLKPCPFCGGEAKITVVKKGFESIIECKTHYCGFMRHSFNNGDTDEHAAVRLATAWNSRANDKQVEGEWVVVYEFNDYRMRTEAKIACSVCGHKPKYEGYLSDMNFCNRCGARMKGGE